jgi:hypothetical protein
MSAKSFDQEAVDAEIFADLYGSADEDGRPELKSWSNAPARRTTSGCCANGTPTGGAGGCFGHEMAIKCKIAADSHACD